MLWNFLFPILDIFLILLLFLILILFCLHNEKQKSPNIGVENLVQNLIVLLKIETKQSLGSPTRTIPYFHEK